MPLVRTLQGATLAGDLEAAYVALADAHLRHRGGDCLELKQLDPVDIDAVVGATERHVDLRAIRAACPFLGVNEERPTEIFNQLGHIFVLLQALAILGEKCSLTAIRCAPTQQSRHEGRRIPDLEGRTWALEAYGGTDITNNDKLALDLRSLSIWRSTFSRTFLACRELAFFAVERLPEGVVRQVRHNYSLRDGRPFLAEADVRVIGRRNGVVVLEVESVSITVRD